MRISDWSSDVCSSDLAGRVGLGPGDDGALLEAEGFVGDDEFGVELLPFAQAVAGGAGALGGVEGEEARFDLGYGEAADGAGELLAEDDAVFGDAEIGRAHV